MKALITHFLYPSSIFDPLLQDLIYNENPVLTKIKIAPNTQFNLIDANKLPAILIKRGEQKIERTSMGDRADPAADMAAGAYSYQRMFKGTSQLMIISQLPAQAEALATEVFAYMNCISPMMRDQLPFFDFQVIGMSELTVADDLGNRNVIVVTVYYEYEYGWSLLYNKPTATSATVVQTVTGG
jgi:hypothetical protein